MIEESDSETYYYHYDGLGSVVALSDSSGDTVQTYEYSVYGQVAVEDPNHPNPYMFAGRRFDIEIGLYYNRARYYNPFIGRFLQTDPIGYSDGMNMYAYCGNNSLNYVDPSGLEEVLVAFYDPHDKYICKDCNDDNPDTHCEDPNCGNPLFTQAADDFSGKYEYSVAMNSTKDVINWLEKNVQKILDAGDTLGGIYFYDHARGTYETMDDCTKFSGMEFGDDFIFTDEYDPFWKKLGNALPKNTAIHFRQCWVGWNADKYMAGQQTWSTLGNLALWTNRQVTGTSGDVLYYLDEKGKEKTIDKPDYNINIKIYWAGPPTSGTQPDVGVWWNPDHIKVKPQPY